MHDPPILILDEPTAGLDPLQIREVRALIRELGERHTILLSTHILLGGRGGLRPGDHHRPGPDRARRSARQPAAARRDHGGSPRAGRRDPGGAPDDPGGRACGAGAPRRRVTAGSRSILADGRDLREAISQKLVSNGWPLRQLDLRRSSLEERFTQAVTQDTLADAQLEAV